MGVSGWGSAKSFILKDLQVYCFDMFLLGLQKSAMLRQASTCATCARCIRGTVRGWSIQSRAEESTAKIGCATLCPKIKKRQFGCRLKLSTMLLEDIIARKGFGASERVTRSGCRWCADGCDVGGRVVSGG